MNDKPKKGRPSQTHLPCAECKVNPRRRLAGKTISWCDYCWCAYNITYFQKRMATCVNPFQTSNQ